MNLTELNKELYNVAEFLSENNRRHYNLNENLLPKPIEKDSLSDPIPREEGLLPEFRDLIIRLQKIAQDQCENISRTQNFILEPSVEVGYTKIN